MTASLLTLVPTYGLWLLGLCTFLSCMAVPAPASILLLAAGGFIAAGNLPPVGCVLAALGGALLGDQAGYHAGAKGAGPGFSTGWGAGSRSWPRRASTSPGAATWRCSRRAGSSRRSAPS